MSLLDGLPTSFDVDGRVSIAPDTMIFIGALAIIALAALRKC